MAEEWPAAAHAADLPVAPARAAGGSRLATVRRDFFLNPAERLSEQERALMTAMLHGLISDIADELRVALPGSMAAANDDGAELIARLTGAGLLDQPALIALLLRRADEEQIVAAVRARTGRREGRLLQSLVSDEDATISAAAMSLILARGRRRNRFGQPRIEFDDLARDVALVITQAVAAGLQATLRATIDEAAASRELYTAASTLAARHDSARSTDRLAEELVRLLDEHGRLDDGLLATAADEGEVMLLTIVFARRAGIGADDAAGMILGGQDGGLMLLLRMAAASRELAARLLGSLGDLVGIGDVGREIAIFDSAGAEQVESARAWMQLDPAFREAIGAFKDGNGQRTL